jgi:2-dehydropantoate 2-reductase
MRYIVYGAGAIGGVVGARLFQQGLEVVLIARGDHLSAIRRDGPTSQSPVGSVRLRVPVLGHLSEVAFRGAEDVVLLTTKTQDNAQALGDLRHAAGAQTPVVCLQNGVEGGVRLLQ